jgi:hypothetical protein
MGAKFPAEDITGLHHGRDQFCYLDGGRSKHRSNAMRSDEAADAPKAPTSPLPRTGTILVREWRGTTHQVTIVGDGFFWNGQTHQSLSSIARAITGTHWNGPRFFGMREPNKPAPEGRHGR